MTKKIAFFQPDGNINNNPNLSGFCNLLVENGYFVDIWSLVDKNNPTQLPPQCNVNLFLLQSYSEMEIIVSDYCFVIGVDYGIIFAEILAKILNIGYAFISYELFFNDELKNTGDIVNKKKTVNACKGAIFAVIQDRERAKFLMKEYEISADKIEYMPVAGTGIISYKPSYYLHDHLSLPHTTKILLHLGSVADWTLTNWAVEHASSLPDDWVLVIHNKFGEIFMTEGIDRVWYSNLPAFRIDQMADMFQSVNCCLGLYQKVKGSVYTGKNLEYMGLSSGKISTALQHGIPVAVNQLGEMTELITSYKAGVVIDIDSDLPFQRLKHLEDPITSTLNCQRLFTEKLDLRNFSEAILEKIRKSVQINNTITIDYDWYKDSLQKIEYQLDYLPLKQQMPCLRHMFRRYLKRLTIKAIHSK